MARRAGWPVWWPGLAVVALAVVLRVAHVLALRATPWFEHLVVDPEYYDAWARRIAAGDWMGERAFYMDPLYPYLLGALYRLVGRDLLVVRLLNVAFSAATCALVVQLGRRLGGAAVGVLAGLGFALYAPEIFYVGEVDKTTLSVFLGTLALVLGFGRSRAAALAAGIALGLAGLTRANFLALAPIGGAALLVRDRRLVGAALFAAGVGATLLPVAWRNHHVSGEWVVTTAQAGQNFYTGNNPTNPYGAYGALPFVRGNPHFEEADFRAEAERRVGHPLGPREVSRFWFDAAVAHVRAQPAFAARAMLRKLALFWNDFEISDNQDQYVVARDSWVLRLPLLGFGAVLPLAAFGAVAGRRRRDVQLLVGLVALYCLSVVVFFLFSRYRIQIVPALVVLAGLGGRELARRVGAREWTPIATAGAVLVLTGVFAFRTIGIFSPRHPQVTAMQLGHLADVYLDAGQPERAIAVLDEAVRACPVACPASLDALYEAYVGAGRVREAEAYFAELAREHPESAARELDRLREREAPSP